jgi:hypothetical protein
MVAEMADRLEKEILMANHWAYQMASEMAPEMA